VGQAGRDAYDQAGARLGEETLFSKWLSTIYAHYSRDQLNQFEHNMEVWMQLWHCLATAHVICIVTDVRNPLWHLPPSLLSQVTQELKKPLVVVLNKCDLVPPSAVSAWVGWLQTYIPEAVIVPFTSSGADLQHASTLASRRRAIREARTNYDQAHTERRSNSIRSLLAAVGASSQAIEEVVGRTAKKLRIGHKRSDVRLTVDALSPTSTAAGKGGVQSSHSCSTVIKSDAEDEVNTVEEEEEEDEEGEEEKTCSDESSERAKGTEDAATTNLVTQHRAKVGDEEERWGRRGGHYKRGDERKRLIEMTLPSAGGGGVLPPAAQSIDPLPCGGATDEKSQSLEEEGGPEVVVVAMVGHPNVGKSSVINALCGEKRVSVSRTAGHTKRAQTIPLATGLCLLDCPGLVFPHALLPRTLMQQQQHHLDPLLLPSFPPSVQTTTTLPSDPPGGREGGTPEEICERERAMQECCGVVPLAQVRECFTAVRFLGEHLDLEKLYGLQPRKDDLEDMLEAQGWGLEIPEEGGHKGRKGTALSKGAALNAAALRYIWSPLSLCEGLGEKRGYFIKKTSAVDTHAAGREILYDSQDGILPFFFLPPV